MLVPAVQGVAQDQVVPGVRGQAEIAERGDGLSVAVVQVEEAQGVAAVVQVLEQRQQLVVPMVERRDGRAGLGILIMMGQRKQAALVVAPPLFSGTFLFVGMMVLGHGAICGSLAALAVRMKKKGLVAVFVLCFLCYMSMGYLSSRDSASVAINWIEQGVNTLGQILLLWGVYALHKAGLREMK